MSGGLWDAGAGISVGGCHIANWLIGQVRDVTQSEENMLRYAREIGANEAAVISAFREVPAMSHDQFERIAQVLFTLANQLSSTAYQNIQQARFIADRKQAEESLMEAEWKFRALFEKGPIDVAYHEMIYDAAGNPIDYRFLDANESYRELTGVDPRGKLVTEAFPGIEHDPSDWIGTFGKVAQSGKTIRFEQYLQANGRWYDCVGYQYKPDHFVAAFIEITKRKQAEEDIKRSEAALMRQNGIFASLLKILPMGVFMVETPSGKPLLANDAARKLLGQGIMPDASRHNLSEVYKAHKPGSRDPYPVDEMPIVRGMLGEVSRVDDLVVERPDGTNTLLEIFGAPVKDDSGHIWASLVSFVDITERKQAEEALRRNEARQGKMVANIGDVIAIIDKEGINQYKSPNIEKWFGWRPEELVGTSAWNLVHPDDLERTQSFFAGLLKNTNSTGTAECRYRCKDGSYTWIELSATNLVADPDIQGILVNYHDLRERKQAEAERAKLEAQFQQAQKMEAVGRLAGGVAHDFNNMLAATMLQLSLLGQNPNLDSEARQAIKDLQSEAVRASNLTRQLLMFGRRAMLKIKPTNLCEVTENLLKMLRRVIGENYTLEFASKESISLVNADEGMMEQVLLNLSVNARDAMPEGGKIRISCRDHVWSAAACDGHAKRHPGHYVCLEVSDTGCGIESKNLATIFEPFYTTKEIGKGTGLGLSTVDGIVTQHKGWIEVESELGRGSIFRAYLPALKHTKEIAVEPPKAADAPAQTGKETILLLEDEASVRLSLQRNLERLGYRTLAARTVQEALELWHSEGQSVDLVLADMVMPGGMTGLNFVKELRRSRPNLPVIIMSGYSEDLTRLGGEKVRDIEFLSKPFGVSDLTTILRRCLDRR